MSKGLLRSHALWSTIESSPRSERSVGDMPVTSVVIDGSITVVYKPQADSRLVVASSKMPCVNDVVTRVSGQVLYVSREHSERPRKIPSGWGRAVHLLKVAFGVKQRFDQTDYAPVVVGLTQNFAPNIVHNGSGDVLLSQVDQHNVDVEIAGSANVQVDGKVDYVQVVISGSGSFKGRHLKSLDASLVIAGSGAIKVEASNRVRSKISGSGSITVFGAPADKAKSVSGSGQVKYA